MVLPATTFAKLTDAGDTASAACTPVPVAATVAVPDCETRAMEPLRVVAVVGLNCTLNVTLCDGASVNGVATPVAAKPWPLTLTCEIVALLLPVFVIVRFCFAELPAFTFPKLKEAGETDKVDVAAMPVPVTAMPAGEFGAFDTTLIVPLVLPEFCGANCTLKVLL